MRQITLSFGGTGTQKWIVDKDTVLVAASSAKQFLISNDPSLNLTSWNSPALGNSIRDQFILSNDVNTQLMNNLAFPLEKNQEIYVTIGSAGNVQLYLEDSLV
jgi:hypothetical protein